MKGYLAGWSPQEGGKQVREREEGEGGGMEDAERMRLEGHTLMMGEGL